MRSRYRSTGPTFGSRVRSGGMILLFIAVIGGLLGSSFIYQYSTEDVVTITVDSKESVKDGDSSYYIVFAPEGEFKVDDSWAYGTFRASTTYNKLKKGKSYKVRTAGVRNGFFSMYPNIVEIIEEVEK